MYRNGTSNGHAYPFEVETKPPPTDYKHAQFLNVLNPPSNQGKVSFALIGLGRAGTIHLCNLLSNLRANLKYVIEVKDERRLEVANLVGASTNIKFLGLESIDTVLSDKSLQAVVITTPTFTHKNLILKALDNGKAVFCEKPIAENYEDVKKCYITAKQAGLPLCCGFNRRFDPSLSELARRVHNGELGTIHVIKTCSRDSSMPSLEYLKTSDGFFHDSAIHDIDLICWTLGEFPTRVFATGTAHRKEIGNLNDFDTIGIQMTFPEGTISFTDLSRCTGYGYDQRIEVFGPGGMLQCNNQPTIAMQSFTKDGVQDQPMWYSFASRYDESYKRELDHFINVVQGKEKLIVSAQNTLAACRIATAAEKSARTGQPVDITYDYI